MIDKIRYWFIENNFQISWFIIGWMTLQGFEDFARGHVFSGILSWALVALNYALVRR